MGKEFSFLKDGKVLIVDDEPEILNIIQSQLSEQGLQCTTAGSGQEALEKIKNETYDVILSDLSMPNSNGIEFLIKIRSMHLHVSFIFLSAYGNIKNYRTALQLGAFDFLEKPFKPEVLLNTVKRAIRAGMYQRKIDYICSERKDGLVEIISKYEEKILQLRLDNYIADAALVDD